MLELLIGIIIVGAFFGQSIFGFGGGMVSVALLGILIDVKDAVSLVLIFQFLIGLLIFANLRTIPWSRMPMLLLGLVVGTIFGLKILFLIQPDLLRIGLAIYIICYLITSLLNFDMRFTKDSPTGDFIAAVFSGLFQGVIGTGGPNLVIHLKKVIPDREVFRSALMLPFFVANLVRILISVPTGLLSKEITAMALPIIPVFIIAIFVGQKIQGHCTDRLYNICTNTLLGLAAVGLIAKSM